MTDAVKIRLPLSKTDAARLAAGDYVMLNGTMLVLRDAGHKRLFESITKGSQAFEFAGETIYFMGPCPPKLGEIIGSAGPTTSCRMDKYTPYMLDNGLAAQIGKGNRDEASREAFARNGAVYFAAIGGAGAIYSRCITSSEIVCFEDLGAEAVRRISVKDFPAVVAIDTRGNCVYK